jgi:hypothetical protein
MHLTFEKHRVDRQADVVDDRVADDFQRTGLGVDFDLGDMAAVQVGLCGR